MEKISTLEFLGMWEELNNPNFNRVEFDLLLSESGKILLPCLHLDGYLNLTLLE